MIKKPTYEELEQHLFLLKREVSDQKNQIKSLVKDKEKFQELHALLRLMTDNVPDMIWAKDMEDRYLFANQSICDNLLHGKSTSEPLGKTDLFFAHREKENGFDHTFGKICLDSDAVVKKSNKPGRFLEDGRVRGKYIVLDVHKAPFYSKSGEMIGTVGCGRDVTKDIEVNNALKNSERRFRKIIEEVSEISIQGYDEKRRVTFWNRFSEKLYGYTKEEALGKKLEDLVIPPAMKNEVKRLHGLWIEKDEKIPAGELVLVDKFGNDVPVFSSHVMNSTQAGKEMFCIDIDLTAVKQSEAERERLQAQLRQSQKMEAIGTLAGGIAHDFNNILFPILGHAEILLTDMPENSQFRESINEIHDSAKRAADLVKQILTFSRQESAELKSIKIQHIVKEVLKLLRSIIPSTIEIRQNIDNMCGAVKADPTQLHQIIMNLTTNAYHAMEKTGGVLTISLKRIESEDAGPINSGKQENSEIKSGSYVCLTIKDTGVGIQQNIIEKIFDPFFTTKKKGKGTGLGLAIVHGIVTEMGGTVKVYSEPGKGTEFKAFFPEEKKIFENRRIQIPLSSIQGGTERILLVDDEAAIIAFEKKVLTRMGYQVTSLTSSVEALEVFRAAPNEFDLVISDVAMPILSGDRLASELIKIRPDIPILICTGFSETITQKNVEELGGKGLLMKPVGMKDLAQAIRNILD
ncbi:PAS domain-containing hybrid sensor histidine kinase/response regulator [Desulfobacula toluolica]|uniref:histidine kinase n=1 Tax=Desulfobacula toluolica (strain DSM 7467 / Tol2) TaxID=651182 RepID=K0N9F2_DESTT|nr:ATP-binding protein [Desulfobacula toluolica]CCK80539.1 two component system sensor histidine kinase, hybrid [Desulfobacula toluolica Tol2]